MSDIKGTLGWFALGYGLTQLICGIFAFYPAFVLSIAIARMFFGYPDATADTFPAEALTVLLFFVIIAIITGLACFEQYFIVLMTYLFTFWPFLYIIGHWANAADGELFPLPIDWCFLF